MEKFWLNLSILFCFIYTPISYAQTWTLNQCIEKAQQENLDVQIQQLTLQDGNIDSKRTKRSFLPDLNGGVTHGYNWGQSIDPFTNQFATNRVQTNNFYLSSSWVLFNGLQNYYGMQFIAANQVSNELQLAVIKRDIQINTTSHYLQVILNTLTHEIAQEQLKVTLAQYQRVEQLVEEGTSTKIELLNIQSQLALDSLNLQQTQSDIDLSKLKIKQLLNIDHHTEFEIEVDQNLDIDIISNTQHLLDKAPEIQLKEQQLKALSLQEKIIKGKRIPSLSMNASIGSGYSGNNQFLTPDNTLSPKPFDRQLDENFYQSAKLTLSIPIYNKGQLSSEIAKTKVEAKRIELQKEQTTQFFINTIEQLNYEINGLEAQKKQLKSAVELHTASFNAAKMKYNEGIISYLELQEIKNRLFETKLKATQRNVQLTLKRKILSLY